MSAAPVHPFQSTLSNSTETSVLGRCLCFFYRFHPSCKRILQMTKPTDKSPSTTGTGASAVSDRHSLTIGADGPIVLHDVHFLEQMAHFNREKVPERQPHAKGAGAFGVFETTEDVSR